ncbi:CRISPR-associated endoribonuclease Cas6 [Thermophagus xiamenensis]|uniref:CRISPR-associated endoribonuclease n=1 Tax=Thermophagus xiamenensis TaxID=385682 RepID=A0A1I2CB58_9BACT|nr:CRISPR-associated endoribonuclease Cas6 [Thermophagus xiamenensis]SFE65587.1 CRISPR-associated protein, Cas6 family [Thermophagus xiamenensis]
MRFQITFNRTGKQRMLPMDYQYYISAWIYSVLKKADESFARFLHEKGYGQSETKLYKLFCFSRLYFGKPKMWRERKLFEIDTTTLRLKVSFDVTQAAATFIKGLFAGQECYIGSRFNGLDLQVTNVQALPEPSFSETMHYRLLSPWVVSYQPDKQRPAQYLKPDDESFLELSVRHITEKFKNTRNQVVPENKISFVPHQQYKRSGFVIKPDTPQQTRVVGNLFDFQLTAPVEVHQMIWNGGVSEKSSLGFGWCEPATQQSVTN